MVDETVDTKIESLIEIRSQLINIVWDRTNVARVALVLVFYLLSKCKEMNNSRLRDETIYWTGVLMEINRHTNRKKEKRLEVIFISLNRRQNAHIFDCPFNVNMKN